MCIVSPVRAALFVFVSGRLCLSFTTNRSLYAALLLNSIHIKSRIDFFASIVHAIDRESGVEHNLQYPQQSVTIAALLFLLSYCSLLMTSSIAATAVEQISLFCSVASYHHPRTTRNP
jgi:hypothetical protein